MTQNDILLEVNGLTVAFEGRRVVEDLHYTLRRGQTLGIVGESGSGKSVSSMALMGLLPKQASVGGSAILDGTDLLTLDEQAMRQVRGKRISMIFQEPMTSLNPVQRCGAQVVEMLRAHEHVDSDEARRRTIGLFKEVMLPRPEKIFSNYPHELSGGQKQRVMIAMALICQPDIIIADEPTTALDVTVQKTILDLLRQLQRQHGTSIIFITHDLGVIAQIADEVLVMYRGKAVESGPAGRVLRQPCHPYTKGLLACRPPLDRRPRRLPTVEEYLQGNQPDTEPLPHPSHRENTAAGHLSTHPLIEVHNLSVDYILKRNLLGQPTQQLRAVDGLSFNIMEGETLGLVGESGCGKSTLGRALLQLIDSSAGNVVYRGTPLNRLSRHSIQALRPKLQIVFQDPYSSLNPRLTIGDAIAEPLRVHRRQRPASFSHSASGSTLETGSNNAKNAKEQTLELMSQVGLDPDWYSRYPHQLSGGQRQRVCIARALILQPEFVVCDESVSALDVSVQAQVLNLLNDLKERYHFTYLFITHDLSVVHYMADRIMVMQNGRVVEQGTPDDLFAHPQTEYTRTLIEAIPRINI